MNKSLVVGAVLGAIVVTAGGAFAGYRALDASRGAEVLSAKAVMRTIRTPREECHEEQVTRRKPVSDTRRLAGTGIGAVVGGLLGHDIGGGPRPVLATVAGAAAGGYAGNKIEQKIQDGETYTTNERRCATVYDASEVPAGYDVEYQLHGRRYHVHMDHDPGARIPVKDGQIVTTPVS